MGVYSKQREFSVSITRKISDWEDNEIFMEHHHYDTLGEALDALRKFYQNDKIMYYKMKSRLHGLAATQEECINDEYSYTMKIQHHGVRRKITAGIDNISQYAHEVFGLDMELSVTQQEK